MAGFEKRQLTELEQRKLRKKLDELVLKEQQRGSFSGSGLLIDDDDIRVYNFREPDKFSNAQLQTLNMLFESFARESSTLLSSNINTTCEIEVTSVEQKSFQEVLKNMADTTIINIFSMKPLEGQAIFEVSPDVAFSLLERTLGGSAGVSQKIRDLTAIERKMMARMMSDLFKIMGDSLESIDKFDIKLDQIETNPRIIQQLAPPMEICVKISFLIKFGKINNGVLNIVLPFIMLESIVSKLSSHLWFAQKKDSRERHKNTDKISQLVEKSTVELRVEVGKATLTLGQIEDLMPTNIIILDKKKDEPFEGFLGDKKICLVRPFVRGGKKVVQIEDVVSENFL